MNLNVNDWKEFLIEDLFEFTRGKTLTSEDKELYEGEIPCINGASENNGVLCCLNSKIEEDDKAVLIKAPALSLSRVGNSGLTLFQSNDFYIADNAFGVKSKENISDECYLFLSTILNQEVFKYSYGRTIALSRYLKTIIKLPATESGEPDWQFMEDYIKSLHSKPLTTVNKAGNVPELKVEEWKEFRVGDVFIQERGKESAPKQNEAGKTPLITETDTNNGFVGNVEPTKEYKGNVITISINFAQVVFYQPQNFCASVNISILRNPNLNKYNGIFIASLLRKNNERYSYGYKISKEKIDNTLIKLPVTEAGEPDWEFMENYIKSLPYGDRV